MDTSLILITSLGSLITLALATYALYLWRKVWQQKKLLQQQRQHRLDKLASDLRILAGSLLDENTPWAEVCIRISVLLEHYDTALSQQDEYRIFSLIHQACEHIPTHQAWKDLPKMERRKHEAYFIELENSHRDASIKAAKQLLQALAQNRTTQ